MGEDGVDAGGVFREGMSRMVEDLFSPDFDLLIQCPNGRQAVGQASMRGPASVCPVREGMGAVWPRFVDV